MKKIIITVILSTIFGIAIAQNKISNVRVQVVDTIVVVTYDLGVKADIEAFVSLNNDGKFMTLKEVSGAVGKSILPEKNKIIIWNVVKELGYVDFPNAVIKVEAVEKPVVEEKQAIVEEEIKLKKTSSCINKGGRFGLDAGVGVATGSYYDYIEYPVIANTYHYKLPSFALGIRYLYNFSPYFGVDFLKVNTICDSYTTELQFMTGVRGNTPTFYKCMSGYAAARAGCAFEFCYPEHSFGGYILCFEIETGVNLTRNFFIGFSYNLQTNATFTNAFSLRVGYNFGKK